MRLAHYTLKCNETAKCDAESFKNLFYVEFAVGSTDYRATSNDELNDRSCHHLVGVYDGTLASDNIGAHK